MIYLLLMLVSIHNNALNATKQANRLNFAVEAKQVQEAQPLINRMKGKISTITTLFNNLQQEIATICTQAQTDPSEAKIALKSFNAKLAAAKKPLKALRQITKQTYSKIPMLSASSELAALNQELAILKKKSLTPDISNQIIAKQQEIAAVNAQIIQEKKIAEEAVKQYILISNAVHKRIHIYAAHKSDPTHFSAQSVASIPPNLNSAKIVCHPEFVYKIKVKNEFGKLKKGKMHFGWKTLHRSKKTQGQSDTFSDADKQHQIIINNHKSFSVHTFQYKGKGSLKAEKAGFIAGMVILAIAAVALGPLFVGTSAAEFAVAVGATEGVSTIAATAVATDVVSSASIGGAVGFGVQGNAKAKTYGK